MKLATNRSKHTILARYYRLTFKTRNYGNKY